MFVTSRDMEVRIDQRSVHLDPFLSTIFTKLTYTNKDIYEFIQRRADWKKIEKTVDKTMYNLSFKEDCIIC